MSAIPRASGCRGAGRGAGRVPGDGTLPDLTVRGLVYPPAGRRGRRSMGTIGGELPTCTVPRRSKPCRS